MRGGGLNPAALTLAVSRSIGGHAQQQLMVLAGRGLRERAVRAGWMTASAPASRKASTQARAPTRIGQQTRPLPNLPEVFDLVADWRVQASRRSPADRRAPAPSRRWAANRSAWSAGAHTVSVVVVNMGCRSRRSRAIRHRMELAVRHDDPARFCWPRDPRRIG